MKHKKTRANPVACMFNKNLTEYTLRESTRGSFLRAMKDTYMAMATSKEDRMPIIDLYPLLYMDPAASIASTLTKFSDKLLNVALCNEYPAYGTCDDTLLCELCLSRRRYRCLKALQKYYENSDSSASIILRRHSFTVPRGIAIAYGCANYLLYNSTLSDKSRYQFSFYAFQHYPYNGNYDLFRPQYSNDMYMFMWSMLEGPKLYDMRNPDSAAKTIDERTRRFKEVRSEIMRGGRKRAFRDEVLGGDCLVMSILQTLLLERAALSRAGYPGVCSRVVIFPRSDDSGLVQAELQSLIVGAPLNPEGADKKLLWLGGDSDNYSKKVRLMDISPIYATSKLSTCYARLSSSEATLHKHIDNLFTYTQLMDNFTPVEFFMYTLGIKSYSDSFTSSGIFREKVLDDGTKETEEVGHTEGDRDGLQSDSTTEGSISEEAG